MTQLSEKFHQILRDLKNGVDGAGAAFLADLEGAFHSIEPDLLKVGATVASEIAVAAETYLTGGATIGEVVASVVTQLPGELKALEHIVATLIGLAAAPAVKAAAIPATPSAAP